MNAGPSNLEVAAWIGRAQIDPAGGLIDRAQVSGGGVRVGGDELAAPRVGQEAQQDAQHAAFAVARQLVRKPQACQGHNVMWLRSLQ